MISVFVLKRDSTLKRNLTLGKHWILSLQDYSTWLSAQKNPAQRLGF